jgi:hypothetical protein
MSDRKTDWAEWYRRNRDRVRATRALNARRYRQRHKDALKVAEHLGVPIAKARELLQL